MEPHHSEERGGLGPRGAEWSRVWLVDLMLEPDSTEAPTYPQVTVRGEESKPIPEWEASLPCHLQHLYVNEDPQRSRAEIPGPCALSVTQLLKPSDRMKVHLLMEK